MMALSGAQAGAAGPLCLPQNLFLENAHKAFFFGSTAITALRDIPELPSLFRNMT